MSKEIIPVLGITLAAFVVWLVVRLVNRRDGRTIWMAVGLIALTAYPVSFGPAVWFADRGWISLNTVVDWYYPVLRLKEWPGEALRKYAGWGVRDDSLTPFFLLINATVVTGSLTDHISHWTAIGPFTYKPEGLDDASDSPSH